MKPPPETDPPLIAMPIPVGALNPSDTSTSAKLLRAPAGGVANSNFAPSPSTLAVTGPRARTALTPALTAAPPDGPGPNPTVSCSIVKGPIVRSIGRVTCNPDPRSNAKPDFDDQRTAARNSTRFSVEPRLDDR